MASANVRRAEHSVIRISWHFDQDEGGEALVSVDERSEVDVFKHVFESLDRTEQIPVEIADAIRKDWREQGEIPRLD